MPAAVSGRTGSVTTFDGMGANNIALCTRWSANIRRDIFDVTPFGATGNAKQKLGGTYSMQGTIEGFIDKATVPDISPFTDDDIPASFVLKSNTTNGALYQTYTFNGLMSEVQITSEAEGVVKFTANFESSGEVTIAAA